MFNASLNMIAEFSILQNNQLTQVSSKIR